MAQIAASHSSAPTDAALPALAKHHFLLRRLHSLTGVLPIGGFVAFHLFTNMQLAFGTFQHEVEWIHSQPALLFMEIFVLWLPIAFHAALGTVYTFSGRFNNTAYAYQSNWRYTLQRITGFVAFIFIFFHVATLRWGWSLGSVLNTPFYVRQHVEDGSVINLATASIHYALQNPWVLLLYVVGIYSAVFHFANGLWTFAITWGLTISKPAQKRWGLVCAGLGATLAVFTALAIWGAIVYKPSDVELKTYMDLLSGAMTYKPH